MCVNHGGGNRCEAEGCPNGASKSGRKTGIPWMCVRHGGGDRCEGGCCTAFKDEASLAKYRHLETKQGMCTAWAWAMVADLRNRNQNKEADELKQYFEFQREIAYRGEQVFYWAMAKMLPILNDRNVFHISLDKPASSINVGPKHLEERRPDYFHVYGQGPDAFALLGEFDDDIDHEDCAERLQEIARLAKVPIERIFVHRINARQGTNEHCSPCTRVDMCDSRRSPKREKR